MYINKLPNAAASKIAVTSTATKLYSLIDTGASEAAGLESLNLNAVDLIVEDGDVRALFDDNTPTTANGLLLSSGNTYYFRGVPLDKLQLIRVGGSNVACSVQVGRSEPGESTNASAHEVTLEAGSVTIGAVSGADIDDSAFTAATDGGLVVMGYYNDAGESVNDGDKGAIAMNSERHVLVQADGYDSGTDSMKGFEVSPLSSHHVEETLADVTDGTDGTYYYYMDMDGYRSFSLQMELSGGSGTCTVTIEATNQDDDTVAASCTYQDVTNALFGAATFTASNFLIADTAVAFKYVRVKVVAATGASDDADWTLYSKKMF